MKSSKKALALALAAAMVVTGVPVTNAEAATTAKLGATKATVYVGSSKYIAVNTPSSWKSVKLAVSSSNKSVASVKKNNAEKKIKVTAVKAGTAKVTVKVTAKKSGKTVKKTLTANVTVKDYKVRLTADGKTVSGTELTAAVGTPVELVAKTAPAKDTVTFKSSDETIATVDAAGKVTPVKAGKVTITASTAKAEDSVTVDVKNYILKDVKQTKYNTLEAVIGGKTSDLKAADIKIANKANNNVVAVQSVAVDSTDATKVTITTFASLTDGATYVVTLDGIAKEITVTDGVVADVAVSPLQIAANTDGTTIKAQLVDKNGIVINEFTTKTKPSNVDFTLSTNQGYIGFDGDGAEKLVLPVIGNKGTVEVKYHTYKFDTNGNEVGLLTKKVEITAVAGTVVTTNGFAMTFADKAPNWDKDTLTNQLAVGADAKDAYFQFKGSDGKEIKNYSDYSVVSSDDSILLLPKTQLTANNSPVSVKAIKAGAAYINVLDKDSKVVKSLPITVVAAGKLTNVTLGATDVTISRTVDADTKINVKAVDQYNNDITRNVTINYVGVNDEAKDAITLSRVGNDIKVVATDKAEAGKTYTVKVEVKTSDVTINRYFNVKTVTTTKTVADATDLRLEVSGLKDGKVDMAIADGASKNDDVVKDVTVKVAAYDNGAKIGYAHISDKSIDNGAAITAEGDTAKVNVVSVDVESKKATKILKSGKTYTVTVTANNKKFTTTFAVVDTQASASVKVNDKKVSNLSAGAKEVVRVNCEVTYNGVTYKATPSGDQKTLTIADADAKETKDINGNTTSIYVSTAKVTVENSNGYQYDVPVTVNTAFTAKN